MVEPSDYLHWFALVLERLEHLAGGDLDEHEGRWRVSAAVANTSKARVSDTAGRAL